jgi:hypothetical protein
MRSKHTKTRWRLKAATTVLTSAILTPLVSAGLFASPAGASTKDMSFSIGNSTTCAIRGKYTYPVNGDRRTGSGVTQLLPGSGPSVSECTSSDNVVYLDGRWTDPLGFFHDAHRESPGSSVSDLFGPIASGFTTNHQAYVDFCGCFSPAFSLTK